MKPGDDWRALLGRLLNEDTERHIAEQQTALQQNPDWAEGHYHLAQLYRVQFRREEARRELLTALELKPSLADAHVALGEMYLVDGDMERAAQHARFAARFGNPRLLEQLQRYGQLPAE
jgi:cytochrome c-type biogenesis protein CcmH/NrfG